MSLRDGMRGESGMRGKDAARRKDAAPSRKAIFVRSLIPDYLLVFVASVALAYTAAYAFYSAPELRSNVLVCAGIAAPMLAILFAGSWSKKAVAPSAVAAVVYAVVVIAILVAQKPSDVPLFVDNQINDVEQNPVVFGFVAVVVPVIVYLLSRRRLGVLVLFVVTIIVCGSVQFLYREWTTAQPGTIAFFAALLSVAALFGFQSYRSAIYGAKRAKKVAFGGAALFSLAIGAVCVLLASVCFYGAIDKIGIATPEIKPFQDYYQLPVVGYTGVYQEQDITDLDEQTSETNDEENKANEDAQDADDSNNELEQWSGNPVSALIRNLPSFDANAWNSSLQAINYETLALGTLFIALAIAALAAIVIAIARWRRKRRVEKLSAEPTPYRVWSMYQFLTQRLERLGFVRPPAFTPLEFAMSSRAAMAQFAHGTNGIDYLEVTLAYQRACYAPETLTKADEANVIAFYDAFFANARKYVGNRRWLRYFWII